MESILITVAIVVVIYRLALGITSKAEADTLAGKVNTIMGGGGPGGGGKPR